MKDKDGALPYNGPMILRTLIKDDEEKDFRQIVVLTIDYVPQEINTKH